MSGTEPMSEYVGHFVCECGYEQVNTLSGFRCSGIEDWQMEVVMLPPSCPLCGNAMERRDPRDTNL